MTEQKLFWFLDLVDKARQRDDAAAAVPRPSNGMEYLCASGTCGGVVVRVVLEDSAGEHEQRLQCQHCNRLFEFPWIQWQWESGRFFEVVEQARNGNEEAKNALCEILGNELKRWIERRLKVKRQDRRDAHQESILRVRQKIEQLRAPENFLGWLRRVAVDVAKQHRTPYLRNSKPEQKRQPKQIGTKTIIVDGKPHVVRIFEPCGPEQPRQPLLEPLSDSIITNWSKGNRPNYPTSIDVWRAMASLPKRWARAMFLMHVEERTAAEAGEILGVSEERVYRLIQKAKDRLRLLLVPYARNGSTESVLRSYKSRQAAATLKRAIPFSNLPPRRCWVLIQLRMRDISAGAAPRQNG